MPTPHIEAQKGEIAERILLPGDPYRSKYIAENFLENAVLFNDVRGALGYTGYYKNKKVSVMGTGMGSSSIGIYAYELINFYDVKTLIRIGTCGAIQDHIKLGDLIAGIAASTDSNFEKQFNAPGTLAASADASLIISTAEKSKELDFECHMGNIVSSEIFYHDEKDVWKEWAKMGVLVLEMEANALYLTAMRHKAKALTLLTVSDSLVNNSSISSEVREKGLQKMITLALEVIIDH